jgi:hypothetical protein
MLDYEITLQGEKDEWVKNWRVFNTCSAWNSLFGICQCQREVEQILRGHTLRRNDETTSLGRTAVNCLYDINQLVNTSVESPIEKQSNGDTPLVCYPWPNYYRRVQHSTMFDMRERNDSHLIVVTSPQVDHDVLVTRVVRESAQFCAHDSRLRTDRRTSRCKGRTARTSTTMSGMD